MLLLVGGDSEIAAAALAYMRGRGPDVSVTTRHPDASTTRIRLDLNEALDAWEPPPRTNAVGLFAAVSRPAACAADPAASARINVTQTLALAERLIARGIYVLFLSTNQVFDGRTPNVSADAPTAPVSEYGRQKARTEAALRAHMARGAPVGILRLAKVVSPQSPILQEWRCALAAGRPIRAFHDMPIAPVPMSAVTRAVEALLAERAPGLFQLSGPHDVAYTEIGSYLAARLGADQRLVEKTSIKDSDLPEGVGPAHTTMDSSALRERYGIAVPDAWQVLDAMFSSLDRPQKISSLASPC